MPLALSAYPMGLRLVVVEESKTLAHFVCLLIHFLLAKNQRPQFNSCILYLIEDFGFFTSSLFSGSVKFQKIRVFWCSIKSSTNFRYTIAASTGLSCCFNKPSCWVGHPSLPLRQNTNKPLIFNKINGLFFCVSHFRWLLLPQNLRRSSYKPKVCRVTALHCLCRALWWAIDACANIAFACSLRVFFRAWRALAQR